MEAQQEQENLLQLADGFQPYVLELPVSEDAADGMMLGLALVVFNRRSGIMLAVPEEFIAQEVLAAGLLAGPDDVIGPSQVVTVPAGIWDPIIGGHPTVAEGQDIAVLLVDCLPDIRANLKPFDPASDPVHIIQHFSEEKTEMFPLAHPLEFAAQDWVENPASGERVNYYSAAEEVPKNVENGGSTPTNPLTTTVPKSAQASVRPGGSGGGKQPPAKKKPTVANLASSVESLAAALPAISTQLATLAKRQTEVEAQMMRWQGLCSGRPIGWAYYWWIVDSLHNSAEVIAHSDAATSYCPVSDTSTGSYSGWRSYVSERKACGGGSFGGGRRTGGLRPGKSSACSESSFDCIGGADCPTRRSPWRTQLKLFDLLFPRINGTCEVAAGISSSERCVLQQRLPEHVQEDVSLPELRSAALGALPTWGLCHALPRTLWRFWEEPGPWSDCLAGCNADGSFADRQSFSGKRLSFPSSGLFGTGGYGFWSSRHRSFAISGGGPGCGSVHEPKLGSSFKGEEFCPSRGATLDQPGLILHQRIRCDHAEASRLGLRSKSRCSAPSSRAYTKAKEQGCSEAWLEERKEEPRRGGRGVRDDDGAAHVPECPVQPDFKGGSKTKNHKQIASPISQPSLDESITFPKLLAALPRWILSSRTSFAGFLAKSFHIQCCGSSPASVLFPLPLPHFGLFKGGGPKLSHRRWVCLLRKRALHVVVVALNFLHYGFRFDVLQQLGRRPNRLQVQAHRRLWALIATCDSPGDFPISPGRSGPEFIARLFELQQFAATCPLINSGSYGEDGLEVADPVGAIPQEMKFVVGEEPGAFAPYRSLSPGRLKLTGTGSWPLDEFLEDELWLPYLEPSILLHGQKTKGADVPNFKQEKKEKNLELAYLWSSKGLLALFDRPPPGDHRCRVFNCFKNNDVDRMIGDRRSPNHAERHLRRGPSHHLPGGYLLTSLHIPAGCYAAGSVTDRKDFYHQSKVSRSRAHSNSLAFSYPRSCFEGHVALEELERLESSGSSGRAKFGDHYAAVHQRHGEAALSNNEVIPGFASLYQGDHLGVEFALSAHQSLLNSAGLLSPEVHIKGHAPFPLGPDYQCLVIDDFVTISVQRSSCPSLMTSSAAALARAKEIYTIHGVLGSPEKDVEASDAFTAVGTRVNSSKQARSRGVAVVSSPPEKIASLIALTAKVFQLPIISRSLASRISGSWTSVLLHRRCLSCVLDKIYAIGVRGESDEDEVLTLTRSTAQELALCCVLSLVAGSDVSVPYASRVFASDASLRKGAIVSRDIPEGLSAVLWLGGDKRGAYTKLDNPFACSLKHLGLCDAGEDEGEEPPVEQPSHGLDFAFDFVEICGGSGSVSSQAAKLGLVVCPPIELSDSPAYNLESPRLLEWICYMLSRNLFRSIMCEPPCATFSAAAHPCVRSYRQPLGFCRTHPKTLLGNVLAFRSFSVLLCAYHYRRPSLLEQPFLSKMAWLSIWAFLMELGFEQSAIASCAFGSVHKKQFRLLSFLLDSEFLNVRCPGGHKTCADSRKAHKPSAVYVPDLAKHFAVAFRDALVRLDREEENGPRINGLESVVLNDLLQTGTWRKDLAWKWRHSTHINMLESNAFVTLLRFLAAKGGDLRFTCLLDSRVAKGSHAKGRSSARALGPSLRKAAAIAVSSGLYGSFGFAPTRLNVADDPTRDKSIRESSSFSWVEHMPLDFVQTLHSRQFSRPVCGWIRFYILLSLLVQSEAFCPFDLEPVCAPSLQWLRLLDLGHFVCKILVVAIVVCFVSYCGCQVDLRPPNKVGILVAIALTFSMSPVALAMPLTADSGEELRRANRRGSVELFADRVIRQRTRCYRETLLEAFGAWLFTEKGIRLGDLLDAKPLDAETIASALTDFGRQMYYAGKPYGRFSETINAVAGKRPAIRKALVQAWDLAFAWQADEPREHHPAMPLSVLLALCSLALLWGWPHEAAIFALTWSGILRIGETLAATRGDLILPCDAAPGTSYALLRILQPKTRGPLAKHQSARIGPSDIIRLLTAVYRNYNSDTKLWSFSSQTLRRRLNQLLAALGLPVEKAPGVVPFDLGSFRPGGATFYLQLFEDSELVRRRGRWVSVRVLEVYLQEISTATFQLRISGEARKKVDELSRSFPSLLNQAEAWLQAGIPPIAWKHLWNS